MVGVGPRDGTTAYTDGACLGNPGPGGWAWAVPDARYASGAAPVMIRFWPSGLIEAGADPYYFRAAQAW